MSRQSEMYKVNQVRRQLPRGDATRRVNKEGETKAVSGSGMQQHRMAKVRLGIPGSSCPTDGTLSAFVPLRRYGEPGGRPWL